MGIWFYFHNVCVCVWIWWGGETAWVWSFPMKCSIEQRQRRGQPQIRCYTKQSNIHLFEGIKSHSRSWYWFRVFFFSLFLFSHTQSEQLNLFRSFHSDIWLQKFEIEIMIRRIDCRGEAGRYPPTSSITLTHWYPCVHNSFCVLHTTKKKYSHKSFRQLEDKEISMLALFFQQQFIHYFHSFISSVQLEYRKMAFSCGPWTTSTSSMICGCHFFFFFNIHIPRIRWSSNA